MAECCNSFGGRISIEIGGIRYPARGEISISPTNIEVAAEANHDGSAYFTSKPVLYTAEMNFTQPCKIDWDGEMGKCSLNVTIVEEQSGRAHLFTAARIVGRPKINLSNGEVSGISIASDRYQKTAA